MLGKCSAGSWLVSSTLSLNLPSSSTFILSSSWEILSKDFNICYNWQRKVSSGFQQTEQIPWLVSVKTGFTILYQSGSFDGFNPQSFTKYLRL